MSSKPIFYNWDDEGSPGRNLTGDNQNRLKQILKACLVDGYGDKKGAGWTIGHEHPNGFSLVNGRGDFVVNFVSDLPAMSPLPSMHYWVIHVYTANSITNINNAIIDGANLCSGTYRKRDGDVSPYNRHVLYGIYLTFNDLKTLQWSVLADGNTFIINVSNNKSVNSSDFTNNSFVVYAGDYIPYNTDIPAPIVLGGDIGAYRDPNASISKAFTGGYSAPINPLTGVSDNTALDSYPFAMHATSKPSLTTTVLKEMELLSPILRAGSQPIGRLKGVVYSPIVHGYGSWQWNLMNLGFDPEYTNANKLKNIDDNQYLYMRHNSGSGSYLTDNPLFW